MKQFIYGALSAFSVVAAYHLIKKMSDRKKTSAAASNSIPDNQLDANRYNKWEPQLWKHVKQGFSGRATNAVGNVPHLLQYGHRIAHAAAHIYTG